jgi:hypothetical protein
MTDLEVVTDAIARFQSIGIRPLIGGSFASSAWGQPRQTHDLDVTVRADSKDVDRIVAAFQMDYVVNQEELREAVENPRWPGGFQLLHYDTTFKIDVFVSEETDYEQIVSQRAKSVEITEGFDVWYVTAEDIVLMKLRWYDLGNRVSDRQWNDLVQVIEIQGEAFDRDYLLQWAEHFGVKDLALEAFSEARP